MNAREILEGMIRTDRGDMTVHSPVEVQARLDAYRAEVLAEGELLPKADVVAWLVKKAREGTPIEQLASKVARGAIRADNLRMLPATFFEPGHTYTREHHATTIRFLVRAVSWAPDHSYRVAFGWRTDEDGDWEPTHTDDNDGWTDVTEAAAP